MRGILLDASALIATFRKETGSERVRRVLGERECAVSSVTLTELEGKLVGKGEYTPDQVHALLANVAPLVAEVPFDAHCRAKAAFYYARRSPYNLSLGDAALLGTAEARSLDVLTAEGAWKKLPDLPFEVEVIR